MKKLTYQATFGHQIRTIEISQVMGAAGSGTWHVLIDRYLHAVIHMVNDEIRIYPSGDTWMTGGDVEALREVVEGMEDP